MKVLVTFRVSVFEHGNVAGSFLNLASEIAENVIGEGVAERCWHVTSEKWVNNSWSANVCIITILELVLVGISKDASLIWSKSSLVEGNLSLCGL